MMDVDDIGMLPLRFLKSRHIDRPFYRFPNRQDSHYLLLHRIPVLSVRCSHLLPISEHQTKEKPESIPAQLRHSWRSSDML